MSAPQNNRKALIAMSGGVDSSVAAKLTLDRGFECIGCTMKLYTPADCGNDSGRTCSSLDDIADARAVALRLGMDHCVFDFSAEFRTEVMQKFARVYAQGATPNPCIDCNRTMKFAKLLEGAGQLGYDWIVTGHYARIEERNGHYYLLKATDPSKDQSYVLFNLTQHQLSHTMFPLGGLTKTEVRALAEQHGFINAAKPDSQDICFVPDGNYAKVVEQQLGHPIPQGKFVDKNGRVLGQHKGIIHYTIGQRRNLGLNLPRPHFVCALNPQTQEVVLGDSDDLYSRVAYLEDCNWIADIAADTAISCTAKVRYRQAEQPATLYRTGTTSAKISFNEPQRAISPGQAAVCYDGDYVLGGGIIASAPRA